MSNLYKDLTNGIKDDGVSMSSDPPRRWCYLCEFEYPHFDEFCPVHEFPTFSHCIHCGIELNGGYCYQCDSDDSETNQHTHYADYSKTPIKSTLDDKTQKGGGMTDFTRITPDTITNECKPVSYQLVTVPVCCLGNCMQYATYKVFLERDAFTYLCRAHVDEYVNDAERMKSREWK